MGMYTELVLKCDLKDNLPPEVQRVIKYLFGEESEERFQPEDPHEFFKCDRWWLIGRCSSYYHHPKALSNLEGTYLFSRSDLKNYDNEIVKFIDWVTPYLNHSEGDCIGWSWYEEADAPTLLYWTDKYKGVWGEEDASLGLEGEEGK